MLELYKLSFHLLFLTIDKLLGVLFHFISFVFFWILLLFLIPFSDKEEMLKKLLLSIKSLDK